MKKIKIPHSFSHNGQQYVCYIGNGMTTGILGYGQTKQKAYEDLLKNKKNALKLSGISFSDWLSQFK